MVHPPKKSRLKRAVRILACLLLWFTAVGLFQVLKPLPAGVDYTGKWRDVSADEVRFLYDLTYERDGARVHEQQIFDRLFSHIQSAEKYILIDMFLFNAYLGNNGTAYRSLSRELETHLIDAKERHPGIEIDVITDPINTVYGGSISPVVENLRAHGINVIITDLSALKDSNPLYSVFWRTVVQWFGNSIGGHLSHPFSETASGVSLRSYLELLNMKANHRKIFTADSRESYVSIVMSANPHDASAAHSNVAIEVREKIAADLLTSETAVAALSHGQLSRAHVTTAPGEKEPLQIRVITEAAIHRAVIAAIDAATSGDTVRIAMFYLSDRHVIRALKSAAGRGVAVRLILDPNKDAFGYEKSGIPNRPVARELVEGTGGSIEVRWYKTEGEQFHSKLLFIEGAGTSTVILGSANLTRRNLENYNLELDVVLTGESSAPIFTETGQYFDRLWHNRDGLYTTDYETYRDTSPVRRAIYCIQERLGVSSF